MSDDPVIEYLIRPQDIRGTITLKRYNDRDYLVWFGSGSLVFFFLTFLFSDFVLFFPALIVCFLGTGFFILMIVTGGDSNRKFWDAEKILITTTGIALRDHQGKVRYLMPFARVTGIRYGYSENVTSVLLDLRVREPLFVRFDLTEGEPFIIPMNYVVAEDRQKIFTFLTGIR